ncbi:DMP19 family protein [Metabacillus bambusae]|uniref:DNA mimic protein DMP19 C-terminal domain-containing protein n=1 Tax=Metabacillus bambusae TaxID=2795218 RepID=A0ABS3MZB7_9BACI|nr:hypothetical protein [Metabacillus bambusae]MBO1511362.1 hypothetical protein [Metabacillus bambusae]
MKPIINRKDLLNKDDIWNAVIAVLSEYDYSTENRMAKEAYTVFQYYAEMESGGHESLFIWASDYIKEVGIALYLEELIGVLEKIDAHEYTKIEKIYGEEMWRLHMALENNEIDESEFYRVIEKADHDYYKLNDQLGKLLEDYFVNIHTDLIEVVDE